MSARTKNTIRTFVAIELPHSAKAHIAAAIEYLRGERIDNLRLVRPGGVHLTLKFLGDIDADRVPAVAEAMSRSAELHPPFSLALGAPGVFPGPNRPRVLWLGVEGDLEQLGLLQASVEEALTAIGFPPDKRGFNPHLTIGRMHHRASRSDRNKASAALSSLQMPEEQPIAVTAVSLMKSTLLPDGAIYECIANSTLTPNSY